MTTDTEWFDEFATVMHGQLSEGQLFLGRHAAGYYRRLLETVGVAFDSGDDGVPQRYRELIVIAVLATLGSWDAVRMHVRRALMNDIAPREILHTFQVAAVSAGMPVVIGGAEALKRALDDLGREFDAG